MTSNIQIMLTSFEQQSIITQLYELKNIINRVIAEKATHEALLRQGGLCRHVAARLI